MNRNLAILAALCFLAVSSRAHADSLRDDWDVSSAMSNPSRWHFGAELGLNASPFKPNESALVRDKLMGTLGLLVAYDISPRFELQGLASVDLGVEGGLYDLTLRPLWLASPHWELGPVLKIGTNGLYPAAFGGVHVGLRAGAFTFAYEPLLGPGKVLDNEDEGGLVLIPLRFTLGVHF